MSHHLSLCLHRDAHCWKWLRGQIQEGEIPTDVWKQILYWFWCNVRTSAHELNCTVWISSRIDAAEARCCPLLVRSNTVSSHSPCLLLYISHLHAPQPAGAQWPIIILIISTLSLLLICKFKVSFQGRRTSYRYETCLEHHQRTVQAAGAQYFVSIIEKQLRAD